MKNDPKNKLDDLRADDFKPLSAEEEKNVTGGIQVTLGNQDGCPEGLTWSSTLAKCVNVSIGGGSSGLAGSGGG